MNANDAGKKIEATLILRTLEGDLLELASDKETIQRFGEIAARVRRGEDPRMLGRAWWFQIENQSTTFPSAEQDMRTATLTVIREGDQYITVELVSLFGSWHIAESLDENGNETNLTSDECSDVLARVMAGENETGV